MKLWRIPNQPITYTHNHFGGLCDFEMWHITLKIITHVSSHKAIFAVYFMKFEWKPLQWRHNERDGVSNHQPHNCLLKRLCKAQIKETSKLRVTGLCSASNGRSPTRSMRIELAVSELEINVRRSMCELENMGIGRIGSLKQSLKPKIRCVYTKTNPCYRPANGLVPDMASILCMFSVRTPADSTDGDREFPQYIVFYRRG